MVDFQQMTKLISLSLALASGFAMCHAGAATAQVAGEAVINGKPVAIEERSIKCGMGSAEILKDMSTRRLVDCDSAELVVLDRGQERISLIRFTIKPDDKPISSGIRAELRDMHVSENGDEIWYRFSTLLPEDFPIRKKHRLVLAQWHERVNKGLKSLRPPLSHRLWDGRFVVTLWNNNIVAKKGRKGDGDILYELPDMPRGVLHEFVYKIVWSPDEEGEIHGWSRQCALLDEACEGGIWRKIIRYRGSTGYDDKEVSGYYFKFGVYTVSNFDVPFTVYHNGYRAGPTAEDVGATGPVFRN